MLWLRFRLGTKTTLKTEIMSLVIHSAGKTYIPQYVVYCLQCTATPKQYDFKINVECTDIPIG